MGQPTMRTAASSPSIRYRVQLVREAYQRVKANQGAPGVDEQSLVDFESDLKNKPVSDLESNVIGDFPCRCELCEHPDVPLRAQSCRDEDVCCRYRSLRRP